MYFLVKKRALKSQCGWKVLYEIRRCKSLSLESQIITHHQNHHSEKHHMHRYISRSSNKDSGALTHSYRTKKRIKKK